MRYADGATLLLLGCIWGSAFMMNDVVVDEVPPLTVMAGRLFIAAIVVTAALFLTGRRLPARSWWPVLLVLVVLNNVIPVSLITWAQQYITSSLAATLNSTMPLMTFLFAVAAGNERFDVDRAFGVVIGFVGAAVLIGPDLGDITSSNALGDLAVLGGSAGYAVSTVIARVKLQGDAMPLVSGQMIFGALIAVPIATAADGPVGLSLSTEAALAWLGLGAVSSGVAYVIFYALVQRMTATSVSLVSYIIPVVATILGWAVLGEEIGWNLAVGLALIILGMVAVNRTVRPSWLRRAEPRAAEPEVLEVGGPPIEVRRRDG